MDSDDVKKVINTNGTEDIDEVSFESYNDDMDGGDDAAPGADPMVLVGRLKAEIKKVKAERAEYLDGWQRANADFANLKKRTADEMEEFRKYAREGLIVDLLPVLESFAMAMGNKDAWEKVDPNWRSGVEYIHSQLVKTLAEHGLEEECPVGVLFDPQSHTSVASVPTDDPAQEHVIAEVVQPGYRLGGKVIRSARVKVYELRKA